MFLKSFFNPSSPVSTMFRHQGTKAIKMLWAVQDLYAYIGGNEIQNKEGSRPKLWYIQGKEHIK